MPGNPNRSGQGGSPVRKGGEVHGAPPCVVIVSWAVVVDIYLAR